MRVTPSRNQVLEQLLRTEAEYAPRLCLKTLRLRLSIRQAIKELAR